MHCIANCRVGERDPYNHYIYVRVQSIQSEESEAYLTSLTAQGRADPGPIPMPPSMQRLQLE
eukprot:scaffold1594_cov401-Prasinococcus_capsulatus_cf.AAC.47